MTFDLILIGLAIALDPIPLTTFMIVLPSRRGVRKGAAFVSGWVVSLAVVVTVVAARLSSWASDLTLAAFCVLASASYLGLEAYAGFRPGRSQEFLARFRTWIDSHTGQLIIAGSLVVGSWLIGKSLYLIAS